MPDDTPAAEAAPRKTQRRITEADKAALAELFKRPEVRVDGQIHIPTVVRLSGLSAGVVYNFVRNNPWIHAEVGGAQPPTPLAETQIIDRPPADGVLITRQQYDEIAALLRQQKKMAAEDWAGLGMSKEAGERMAKYGQLGRAPLFQITSVAYGQLIKNLELLDRIVDKDAQMILAGKFPAEVDAKGDPRDPDAVERDWRYCVFSGMKLQLDIYANLHKVQAIMAKVMRDLKDMKPAGDGAKKGVYSPTPVAERPIDE